MSEKKDDKYQLPYSNEWLEQHREYQYKRLIRELKKRDEEERRKPFIIRMKNKILSKIQFHMIDIEMNIRMRFDKNMREEIEGIIKEHEQMKAEKKE